MNRVSKDYLLARPVAVVGRNDGSLGIDVVQEKRNLVKYVSEILSVTVPGFLDCQFRVS